MMGNGMWFEQVKFLLYNFSQNEKQPLFPHFLVFVALGLKRFGCGLGLRDLRMRQVGLLGGGRLGGGVFGGGVSF